MCEKLVDATNEVNEKGRIGNFLTADTLMWNIYGHNFLKAQVAANKNVQIL